MNSPIFEVSVRTALHIWPHPLEGEIVQAVVSLDVVIVQVAHDAVEICVRVVRVLVLGIIIRRVVLALGRVLPEE